MLHPLPPSAGPPPLLSAPFLPHLIPIAWVQVVAVLDTPPTLLSAPLPLPLTPTPTLTV